LLKLLATSIVTSTAVWQHQAMGKQMTITGCIAEKDGK
jgi:hypothetical protein